MEEKKNNIGLIITLIIFIILSIILGGYIVYDKVINKEKSPEIKEETKEEIKQQEENNKNEDTIELKNYNINNIKNIEIRVPVLEANEPKMKSTKIDNKQEIKEILLNVDKKEEIGKIPNGIDYTYNVTITINYEDNSSTVIIIWDNSNISINSSDGEEENNYIEYKIENNNLASELTNKYQ